MEFSNFRSPWVACAFGGFLIARPDLVPTLSAMNSHSLPLGGRLALVGAALAAPCLAQNPFQQVSGLPPQNFSAQTRDAAPADVDLDGDWDVLLSQIGFQTDGTVLWMNQNGASFTDESATRLPSGFTRTWYTEFGDLDADSDPDVIVAADSDVTNQSNRIWINSGVGSGFFANETLQRFVGLGQPGSSVDPTFLLPTGGFVDWSRCASLADLDNDGDLDLVQASANSPFSGVSRVPTRIFLNDGAGVFEEFNPSGFQVIGGAMNDGDPALWAEGFHSESTTDISGTFADITGEAEDLDLVDLNGDFDIDVLIGDARGNPRAFRNRFSTNGGVLSFRDLTSFTLGNTALDGSGFTPEQELADLDGDGDLDLYGVNWGTGSDTTNFNFGGRLSTQQAVVPGSGPPNREAEIIDFDADGDLDVVVASEFEAEALFDNDFNNFYAFFAAVNLDTASSYEAAVFDFDGDADYDLLIGREGADELLENTLNIPDTTPPYLPRLEEAMDRSAAVEPYPLRVQVYDNASLSFHASMLTEVEVRVGGCVIDRIPAKWSGGQIFRAEIPGNLLGDVELTWIATDENGNAATSEDLDFVSSFSGPVVANSGTATLSNLTGESPRLEVASVPFAGSTLYLVARGAPGTGYLLALTDALAPAALPLPGLLLSNLGGQVLLTVTGGLDPDGCDVLPIALKSGIAANATLHGQVFTFEGATNGDLLVSSQATSFTTQ